MSVEAGGIARRLGRRALDGLRSFWRAWSRDNAALLAAGVSFYAIFSLGPLLALILFLGSRLVGEATARAQFVNTVGGLTTPRTAAAVGRLADAVREDATTGVTALTASLLLFGASSLFRHLRAALDLVLDVPRKEQRGWVRFLVSRLVAVLMVVAAILALLATILLTSALAVARQFLPELAVGDVALWRAIDLLLSTAIVAALFAATLKFAPDVRLAWRRVGLGAAVAAVLFSAARFGLAAYLSRSDVATSYGAAASLVVVLIAIYLAVATLFVGAEITGLAARRDPKFARERERRRGGDPETATTRR